MAFGVSTASVGSGLAASVSAGSAVSVGSAVSSSSLAVGSSVSTVSDASGVSLASSLGPAGATVVGWWLPPTIAVVANAAPAIRNSATNEVPIERIIRCVVFIASVSPAMWRALPVGLPSPAPRHAGRTSRFQAVASSMHRDRAERRRRERLGELLVVTDQHDGRRVRADVLARDPQDVVGRDRLDRAPVALELVVGQAVDEQAGQRARDGSRCLEPQREHADEEVARGTQLRVLDRRLADPVELAQDLVRAPGR